MTEYHWRIKQDGLVVAGGFTHSLQQRDAERFRYGCQYAQEGPVVYELRTNGSRWKRER